MRWVKERGVLISPCLDPVGLPPEAAEALDASNFGLRSQAYRMVSHLFNFKWDLVYAQPIDDKRWQQLKAMLIDLGVTWDRTTCEFVATRKVQLKDPPPEWLPTKLIR